MTCRVAVLSSTAVGRRSIEGGLLPIGACSLVGILTTPRDIRISYSDAPVTIRTHTDFSDLAESTGCEVVCLPDRPTPEAHLSPLQRWAPDLILVLGWYYKVERAVRSLARFGCLGIHASLLPKYRGGAPVPWAIINGERETGVTLFHLEDEVDAGDIVAQRAFPIDPADTAADVLERVTEASVDVLRWAMPLIADGRAPRRPQDHGQATWCRQRTPDDGRIDWRWTAARIHDFVRAQTRPYPGAFTVGRDGPVTVWAASPAPAPVESPGTYHLDGATLAVGCGEGSLRVRQLGLANGQTCTPAEFADRFGHTGTFA